MRGPVCVAVAVVAALAGAVGAIDSAESLVSLATQPTTVEERGNGFVPKAIVVRSGDTVAWTNTDSVGHTVTADDGSVDSHPACASGGTCQEKGEVFQHTFTAPGKFPYYCRVHGGPAGAGMAGTVEVLP